MLILSLNSFPVIEKDSKNIFLEQFFLWRRIQHAGEQFLVHFITIWTLFMIVNYITNLLFFFFLRVVSTFMDPLEQGSPMAARDPKSDLSGVEVGPFSV